MPQRHLIRRAAGITRSLITYYGPIWRRTRMEAFYRQFLQAGDLAFDIGAHVGNRVRVFRRIGARVIAVEPQPDFIAVLRLLYGRDSGVSIEASGVAAEPGQGQAPPEHAYTDGLNLCRFLDGRCPNRQTIPADSMGHRDQRAARQSG